MYTLYFVYLSSHYTYDTYVFLDIESPNSRTWKEGMQKDVHDHIIRLTWKT